MKRRIVLYLSIISVFAILSSAIYFVTGGRLESKKSDHAFTMPTDVQAYAEDFHFFSDEGGIKVEISGKRMVRRGARFLYVRSMVVKKNYFEDIKGKISGMGKELAFSAREGELNGKALFLKGNVQIQSGKEKSHFERATIDLGSGRVHGENEMKIKVF